jgi:hypothetical protein
VTLLLARPDVPLFWACGVATQAALMASCPPFAITHASGHMFMTDMPNTDYRVEDLTTPTTPALPDRQPIVDLNSDNG